MVNQRDKPINKFEDMSGFKEIESTSNTSNGVKFIQVFLVVLKTATEFFDEYLLPLFLGMSIVFLMFDLVFYGADVTYNFFRLLLLCVLLFYRYKRGKFY